MAVYLYEFCKAKLRQVPIVRDQVESKSTHKSWKKWRQDPSWLQTFFFILHGQFLNKERGDFWRNYSRDVFLRLVLKRIRYDRCAASVAMLFLQNSKQISWCRKLPIFFSFVHVKNCPFVETQCIKSIEKSLLKIVAKNSTRRKSALLLKIQFLIPWFWSNSMIS